MSNFKREERYIVVKLKRIDKETEEDLREFLDSYWIPTEQCVVVEHDWPNYEHTWETIKQVIEGTFNPNEITNLRHQLQQAEARVAELHESLWHCLQCWEYDGISDEHGAVASKASEICSHDSPDTAYLLRKQAEAAESAIRVALRNLGNVGLHEEDIDQFAYDYAQRLRQRATELEQIDET